MNPFILHSARGLRPLRSALCLFVVLCALGRGAGFLPAIAVEEILISDSAQYTALMVRANEAMRTRHQVPVFLRAYVATAITGEATGALALTPAASFEILMRNRDAFAHDAELAELRSRLRTISRSGPTTYCKAVRFDGTNTPGWLFNTLVKTGDEAALLARVAELAAFPAPPGRTKPMLNVFRVVAGDFTFTHLVSVNAASAGDLAATLDLIASAGWTLQSGGNADGRTEVVRSGVYRELSP